MSGASAAGRLQPNSRGDSTGASNSCGRRLCLVQRRADHAQPWLTLKDEPLDGGENVLRIEVRLGVDRGDLALRKADKVTWSGRVPRPCSLSPNPIRSPVW
jgi:hypothetical protein